MRKEYNELPAAAQPRLSADELARIIDFVEQMEDETESALGLRRGNRELRILLQLMRDHINGRLSTQSSLVAASGLAYGTALRVLQDLVERGMITKRTRTKTGKSFSLHPTGELIRQWREYGRRVKAVVGGAFGLKSQRRVIDDYYFGASYMCANVIQRPAVMAEGIGVPKLNVLFHADPTFMAMAALKNQMESIFDTNIKNKALSIDRLYNEILKNSEEKKSKYDIISCDLPWFGKLARDGVIMPLDDFLEGDSFDISDFYPAAVNSARWNGVQYGIPVQTSPEMLVYRRDLFDEAGVAPPTTVEEVLSAAKRFHRPHRGMSGIAWNAAKGTPLGHSFLMMMAAFGQPVINLRPTEGGYDCANVSGKEYRPMLTSDEARATAEYMLALLDVSPSNVLTMSWYERAKAYAEGSCAMSYCYSLLASIFERNPKSPANGNSAYLPHPRGLDADTTAPVGGYALAVPANVDPARKGPIWTAIKSFTSAEATKQYVIHGSTASPRFSVASDPEVFDLCPLIAIVDEMVRKGQVQHSARPPIPEIPEIISIIGTELHPMLCGDIDAKTALDSAQNKLDALMRANGHY